MKPVVFCIPATSANSLQALVAVTLCNLRLWPFPSSTGTYTGGGGGGGGGGDIYVVVAGAYGNAGTGDM